MDQIKNQTIKDMNTQHFDCIAVGVIDFNNNSFESFEYSKDIGISQVPFMYFDLASITKVLNLASFYLMKPELFNDEMKLLLNHRAGLPAWARLDKKTWREFVSSYKVKESECLYSDLSALRLQVEIENIIDKPLWTETELNWDEELMNWIDLPNHVFCPITGMRNKNDISGSVHDDNAYNLEEKVSHAGIFSTVNGLAKTILNLESNYSLIETIDKSYKSHDRKKRFINGWDTVQDPENTLAGKGCSSSTFGHLGFTGTSIWIDVEKKRGSIILTNSTQYAWYDKKEVNQLRKIIGSMIWSL